MGELSRALIPADVDGVRAKLRDVLVGIDAGSRLRLLDSAKVIAGDCAKVVFAGEIQTGKSSLINALLNRVDLLPVGAGGATTATYVAVAGGATEGIQVELRDGHTATDDLTAVDRYTSTHGGQVGEIIRAAVLVDEPELSTLTVIDTPGIGNPDAAFGRLTLDALGDATALVFVCAAGNKISTAERNFIAEASRRIDRIVFVLNRIDEHQQWRDSLHENENTVRADQSRFRDGRFANITFIPVSARKALEPALRKRSGIENLWEQLRSIADKHTELGRLNELRFLRSMISDVQDELGQRWKALEDAAGTETAALDEQLKTLSAHDKAWRSALKSEIVLAKGEVQRLIEVHKMELRADYQNRIGQQLGNSDDIMRSLAANLSGMQLQADKSVRQHTAEIARRLLTGLPGTESAIELLDAQLPNPSTSMSAYIRERPPRPEGPMEKFTDMQSTFMGWSMTSGAAGVALAAMSVTATPAVLIGAAIGVPGALLWRRWAKQVRERSAEAAHTKTWVQEQIGHATKLIDKDISQAFTNAERQLRKALESAFTDAGKELEELRGATGREEVEEQKRKIRYHQQKLGEVAGGCDKQLRAATVR
jgi:GTPase SAR1 family protein